LGATSISIRRHAALALARAAPSFMSSSFAVFEASVEPQEHDANQPTPTGIIKKRW
jgi:hypothetical protein